MSRRERKGEQEDEEISASGIYGRERPNGEVSVL
jgi:hypothetical protein